MTITVILAMIGGTTLILTAAARIPPALAEFLRACIPVVTALRELRIALNGRPPAVTQPRLNTHRRPLRLRHSGRSARGAGLTTRPGVQMTPETDIR
jgi:hypothetical protein